MNVLAKVPPNATFVDETLRGYTLHLSAHFQGRNMAAFVDETLRGYTLHLSAHFQGRNMAAYQGSKPVGSDIPVVLTVPLIQNWRLSCKWSGR